jgi:CAAX prenyl protease-like protein
VPWLEEVFWRGFLLRYLVREDFLELPFGTCSRFSFLVVALAFMCEHRLADWPAAVLTGALYNGVAIWTRSLPACVLAHALTNLLLGGYVMHTQQWGFW